MDTGGGQIVCRTPRLDFSFANEHFAAASERLLEDGRGFTAGNGGGRQKYCEKNKAPPNATRSKKTKPGAPSHSSDPSMYVLIYTTRVIHTTSGSNGLIYGYTCTRSLPILHVYTAAAAAAAAC